MVIGKWSGVMKDYRIRIADKILKKKLEAMGYEDYVTLLVRGFYR